jgi:hypothetical protein
VSAPTPSAFQAARLAAAQPVTAAAPVTPVAVTPALVVALDAALKATAHDIPRDAHLELECLLLQCRILLFRKSLS